MLDEVDVVWWRGDFSIRSGRGCGIVRLVGSISVVWFRGSGSVVGFLLGHGCMSFWWYVCVLV